MLVVIVCKRVSWERTKKSVWREWYTPTSRGTVVLKFEIGVTRTECIAEDDTGDLLVLVCEIACPTDKNYISTWNLLENIF